MFESIISNIPSLFGLGVVAFIQNMFFTWSSRSRNSADPGYHRKVAWGSNGVWYVCQMFIITQVWTAIKNGDLSMIIAAGIIYILATSEGSVFMMKKLLNKESGKRKVGASK